MRSLNHDAADVFIAWIGSGDLISKVIRGVQDGAPGYTFQVDRLLADCTNSSSLRATDLRSIVKLCQVLAFTIADDGWLGPQANAEMFRLADDLDYITHQWEGGDRGCQTFT